MTGVFDSNGNVKTGLTTAIQTFTNSLSTLTPGVINSIADTLDDLQNNYETDHALLNEIKKTYLHKKNLSRIDLKISQPSYSNTDFNIEVLALTGFQDEVNLSSDPTSCIISSETAQTLSTTISGLMHIGMIFAWAGTEPPLGAMILSGQEFKCNSAYPDFWKRITSESFKESTYTYNYLENKQATFDQLGKFGVDEINGYVRLPNLCDKFIQGVDKSFNIAANISAGLPSLPTGSISMATPIVGDISEFTTGGNVSATRIKDGYKNWPAAATSGYILDTISLNNNVEDDIYGKSITVQPPSIKYNWCIQVYNTVNTGVSNANLTVIHQNIEESIGRLNQLELRLKSVDFVTKYEKDIQAKGPNGLIYGDSNKSWYRKYNSGWIEQGGQIIMTTVGNYLEISFPIQMENTNYTLIITPIINEKNKVGANEKDVVVVSADGSTGHGYNYGKKNTGFRVKKLKDMSVGFNWQVSGQGI